MAEDDDLRTARVLLSLLGDESTKAEAVLARIAEKLKHTDDGLALALMAQARTLRLAAEEGQRLVALLWARV